MSASILISPPCFARSDVTTSFGRTPNPGEPRNGTTHLSRCSGRSEHHPIGVERNGEGRDLMGPVGQVDGLDRYPLAHSADLEETWGIGHENVASKPRPQTDAGRDR